MADPRSRRTGEHNAQVVKLMEEAAAMKERLDTLEGRVLRLEAELSSSRKSLKPPAAGAGAPRPGSKRPGAGPPPLPAMTPAMPALPKAGGRKSIVDISEIAELVESIPPPPPRSRR